MGVQQLIANNTNILTDAVVIASTVAPSAEITRTAMTRAGTGLVDLTGLFTGHESADYAVEIVSGEGNGRTSTPGFSGVGSGSIAVTSSGIPAQDVTITLLTPPYPGAVAECRIGTDIIKAVDVGDHGNAISLTVNRSGLMFAASGSATLEEVAAGSDTLTLFKWDIPGVACSSDLKGNVAADAPRLRFGTDPAIYRVIKDSRSGKAVLSPAAVREIPASSPIWIVSGCYAVTVTDGVTVEIYTDIVTTYDLTSVLLTSSIVTPAYTPAPITTIGGNAVTDLPLVTGAAAILSAASSAAVRPADVTARLTANADTITMQSKGNGSWTVKGASGTAYPDAREGSLYAPQESPVILTIPAKVAESTVATQPVYISGFNFPNTGDNHPIVCIDGKLGKNAVPKSITATYATRPPADFCICPTTVGRYSSVNLGIEINNVLGGDDVDPILKTKLLDLYQRREMFVRGNTEKQYEIVTDTCPAVYGVSITETVEGWVYFDAPNAYSLTIEEKRFKGVTVAQSYEQAAQFTALFDDKTATVVGSSGYIRTPGYWSTVTVAGSFITQTVWVNPVYYDAYGTSYGWTPALTTTLDVNTGEAVVTGTLTGPAPLLDGSGRLAMYFPSGLISDFAVLGFASAAEFIGDMLAATNNPALFTLCPVESGENVLITPATTTIETTLKDMTAATADIAWFDSCLKILVDSLNLVYTDPAALAMWDNLKTELMTELDLLLATAGDDLTAQAPLYLERYRATVDNILLSIGIVPGKVNPSGSTASTGCWTDEGGDAWWLLSDGYAPAFTGKEYYSTRAGTFENSQEFAFMIKCSCPGNFFPGDQLTIQIGANLTASVWSSNESLTITTIPTTPLYLAGGKDPDDSETWSVAAKNSLNVALPPATMDSVARSYAYDGLSFTIATGGVPFSVGDRFKFTVEGGTFKWNKNGGAWSATMPIADDTLLDDGLAVAFLSGAAPSFVTGDNYSFSAGQPSSASGLLTPSSTGWQWDTSTATITLTFPAIRSINTLAMLHTLPTGAAIAVDYSLDGVAFTPLTWASGVVRDYLHVTSGGATATKALRLTVDHPGAIKWLWAGVPFQPEYSAGLRIRKLFDVARSKQAGSASLLGQGEGATLSWDMLTETDAIDLVNLVRHVKTSGDQPVILVPQHLHPEEAILCRLADDGIELTDIFEYQPDDTAHRILSATMEMVPEWR